MKLKMAQITLSILGTTLLIVLLFVFLATSGNETEVLQKSNRTEIDKQIPQAKASNIDLPTESNELIFGARAVGLSDTFSVLDNSVVRNSAGFKQSLTNNNKATKSNEGNNCNLKPTDRRLPLDTGKKDHNPGSFEHIN